MDVKDTGLEHGCHNDLVMTNLWLMRGCKTLIGLQITKVARVLIFRSVGRGGLNATQKVDVFPSRHGDFISNEPQDPLHIIMYRFTICRQLRQIVNSSDFLSKYVQGVE